VLVIIWMWRARKNLDAFPGAVTVLGAGWAIGAWFTPLVNFAYPVRIMRDLVRGSVWRGRDAMLAVSAVWWGLWLAYAVLQRFALRQEASTTVEVILTGLYTAAGALLAVLVKRITDGQSDRVERGLAERVRPPAAPMPVATVPAIGETIGE
jgi:hypothetical protein